VPGRQVPLTGSEQQPDAQGSVDEQAFTHCLDVWLHELAPDGQSASDAQPHCPPAITGTQTWPLALPPHAPQTPPLEPHAASRSPVWQVPPCALEQQPPWQGWVPSQLAPQRRVVGSQALLVGQSLAVMQPQLAA